MATKKQILCERKVNLMSGLAYYQTKIAKNRDGGRDSTEDESTIVKLEKELDEVDRELVSECLVTAPQNKYTQK